MRTPKPCRQSRQPLDRTIELRQIRAFNQWADRDADAIDRELQRMLDRVRTLRNDEAKGLHKPSQGAVLADAAIWNEHTIIEEQADDFLIPRQSLTSKLCLRLFRPILELRSIPGRQLSPESKERLARINATVARIHPDNRAAWANAQMKDFLSTATYVATDGAQRELLWKSDETLLNRRRGFDTLDKIAFKRQSSHTKETAIEIETSDLPCKVAADGSISWDVPTD